MLETPRLLLRNFRREDLEAVHGYASDPRVTRFMAWGPNTYAETLRFVDTVVSESMEQSRKNFNFAVTLRDSGKLIGACGLDMIATDGRQFVLGYCLAAPYWRTGYGAEAVRALVAFGFEELCATRVVAYVFAENVASQALLRRLNFVNIGIHLKHVSVRGEWHDEYEFGRDA